MTKEIKSKQPIAPIKEADTTKEISIFDITTLPDFAKDYLKEEQKQRRQEIENFITRIENDQRNTLVIIGVFWSWLISGLGKLPSAKAIVYIPAIVTVFFFYRWWKMHQAILAIAEYTRKLESVVNITIEGLNLGWETWLEKKMKSKELASLGGANQLFWCVLSIVNIVIAILFTLFHG